MISALQFLRSDPATNLTQPERKQQNEIGEWEHGGTFLQFKIKNGE